MTICPACGESPCAQLARCRYPYTHHGPAIHGDKIVDYLISETNMLQDKERETAMSDLAKRLLNYEGPGMLDPAPIKLMREAADEIARLTALEAKLRAEIQRQSDDRRTLRGDLAEARGIIDGAFGAVSAAYDQAHAEWHHHDKRAAKCDKTVFDWRSAARAFLDKGEG